MVAYLWDGPNTDGEVELLPVGTPAVSKLARPLHHSDKMAAAPLCYKVSSLLTQDMDHALWQSVDFWGYSLLYEQLGQEDRTSVAKAPDLSRGLPV